MSLIPDVTSIIPGLGILTNPFGLPSFGLWNLQKGSFTTPDQGEMVFYVEVPIGNIPGELTAMDTISDSGGRRLAVYEYPYVDGQAVADLGRKAERFVFNIKFFGSNYQLIFKEFIAKITQSSSLGKLNHPVRGTFNARFLEWEYVHRYDEWSAVTIKATFIQDDTNSITQLNVIDSINSFLRQALQVLSSVSSLITTGLAAAVAIKRLPGSLLNNLLSQFHAVAAQVSSLLGQLAATFSTDAQTQSLFASASSVGSVLNVNTGTSQGSQLPPVYQVGFSAADQANIDAQSSAFVNANQVTPQQALYGANQARAAISANIAAVTAALGNDGFDVVLQYRILAIQIQTVTQAAITSIQSQITLYTVPYPMSLRMVSFLNGLTVDRQNDIVNLNPFVQSINYISAGTVLQVPSS